MNIKHLLNKTLPFIPDDIKNKIYTSNITLTSFENKNEILFNIDLQNEVGIANHINVEAKAIINYKDELSNFKITPKGMLQIFVNQLVPFEVLKEVFGDVLIN